MKKSEMNSKVDEYLRNATRWREEMERLRRILLGSALTEELKWGKPCYTFHDTNVVLIVGFKEYCALLFCKGALLKDARGILVKAGEHTQAARQIRFTSLKEIVELEPVLKAYVAEAVEAEKAGLTVTYKKISEFSLPEEFQTKLDESPALQAAFHALTPGRQRAYLLHFSAPKQSKTRESRIEKWMPQILNGKGMND